MQYRIELSPTRRGAARIHLPGRILELHTRRLAESEWEVSVSDPAAAKSGTIAVRAPTAHDAVWRVARAAVRAIAELTGRPLENGAGET
ncbi:MAG TPA: hypothetical protein VJ770_21615 [Stellaceae bacterium]|nr:hypothetical protein [Stellaceae bacterium]